ncbi:PDCD5-related protein [Gilbertella persicaria]|uniref:PDCD5-related protein n=1 Tax=Gilbertella persicaria TaxID=101096 RepID=UPI00221FA94D|nr:PDCD5-related protein [Gilbertella persicaria]KAI8091378.1 PDCD5-related protein [Gilbertella persicaria]
MEDDELQAIRARRLAELQAKGGSSQSAGLGGAGFGAPAGANASEDAEKKGQMEEMRRNMLYQILDNSARERLGRIQMVKAEKARAVEDLLIRMAQSNQLRSKVTEKQLIDLLGQLNQQDSSSNQTRIVYNRRQYDDSDDDYDL